MLIRLYFFWFLCGTQQIIYIHFLDYELNCSALRLNTLLSSVVLDADTVIIIVFVLSLNSR